MLTPGAERSAPKVVVVPRKELRNTPPEEMRFIHDTLHEFEHPEPSDEDDEER